MPQQYWQELLLPKIYYHILELELLNCCFLFSGHAVQASSLLMYPTIGKEYLLYYDIYYYFQSVFENGIFYKGAHANLSCCPDSYPVAYLFLLYYFYLQCINWVNYPLEIDIQEMLSLIDGGDLSGSVFPSFCLLYCHWDYRCNMLCGRRKK